MDIADNNGNIITNKFTMLGKDWKSKYTIKDVLTNIKLLMSHNNNKNLKQPKEGDTY
jgi:ubiquitin-protein ligase